MYDKTPNCDECIPPLLPENEKIFELFMMVRNQHIMGFSGPVDLDFNSVKFAMETLGIENTKDNFDRLYRIYNTSLNKMREKSEADK